MKRKKYTEEQIIQVLKEGIAVNFGGHHDNRGLRIQGDVSGEDSNLLSVAFAKVPVLLITEGFDGGPVNDRFPALARLFNRRPRI